MGAFVVFGPDGAGAGGDVDAADVVVVGSVDADVEAVGAGVAEVVLEYGVEPVQVAVGVWGFDLGVVVVETDRFAIVGDADQ